jgi:hypothetical protein
LWLSGLEILGYEVQIVFFFESRGSDSCGYHVQNVQFFSYVFVQCIIKKACSVYCVYVCCYSRPDRLCYHFSKK